MNKWLTEKDIGSLVQVWRQTDEGQTIVRVGVVQAVEEEMFILEPLRKDKIKDNETFLKYESFMQEEDFEEIKGELKDIKEVITLVKGAHIAKTKDDNTSGNEIKIIDGNYRKKDPTSEEDSNQI